MMFVDSEIWPNMLLNIKKRSISLILLNARITTRSFKNWITFRRTAQSLFSKFDICLTSNNQSKKYLKILGARNIKNIGNLKFSQSKKDGDYLNSNLKKKFSSKKIWCASSIHLGEEKYCALVHKNLRKKYKNLLTVIIPRHVDRINEITNKLQKLKLKVYTHDSHNKMPDDTDIYLVNSYGKTKSFFKICKIVFLGGSIIKHGGQNPLEPARYGCKILHGPNIWNFKEIYSLLNKFKISNKASNVNQITKNINKLFENKTNTGNIKSKINNLGKTILSNTLKEINYFFI